MENFLFQLEFKICLKGSFFIATDAYQGPKLNFHFQLALWEGQVDLLISSERRSQGPHRLRRRLWSSVCPLRPERRQIWAHSFARRRRGTARFARRKKRVSPGPRKTCRLARNLQEYKGFRLDATICFKSHQSNNGKQEVVGWLWNKFTRRVGVFLGVRIYQPIPFSWLASVGKAGVCWDVHWRYGFFLWGHFFVSDDMNITQHMFWGFF